MSEYRGGATLPGSMSHEVGCSDRIQGAEICRGGFPVPIGKGKLEGLAPPLWIFFHYLGAGFAPRMIRHPWNRKTIESERPFPA